MDVHFAEKKSIVFYGLEWNFRSRSAIISPDLSILSFLIQHMGKVLVFGALEARASKTHHELVGGCGLFMLFSWLVQVLPIVVYVETGPLGLAFNFR